MSTVEIERRDAVAIVRMASANALNVLDRSLRSDVEAALSGLASDRSVAGVVLTGSSRVFSVGVDHREIVLPPADPTPFLRAALAFVSLPERIPQPVVAAVEGLALAGGFELAMACDWIVASREAELGLPEALAGLVPGYAMVRLPSLVGEARAKRLMLEPGRISASRAAELGLHVTVCDGDVIDEAVALCTAMTSVAPRSARLIKQYTNRWMRDPGFDGLIAAYGYALGTEDAREGLRAVAEKRSPVFRDR